MPRKDKDDKGKRPPRYIDGIWLSANELSSEIFFGTPEGINRSRSIMQRPEKWNRLAVEAIVEVTWYFTGDGEDAIPKVVVEDREAEEVAPTPTEAIGSAPRRLRIPRDDLNSHGFTVGCTECQPPRFLRDTQRAQRRVQEKDYGSDCAAGRRAEKDRRSSRASYHSCS